MDNAYSILGISTDASAADIRFAFRAAAMRCHPDRNNLSQDSHESMLRIQDAYRTLIDPTRRVLHDTFLQTKRLQRARFTTVGADPSNRNVVAGLRKFSWGTRAHAYRGGLALA